MSGLPGGMQPPSFLQQRSTDEYEAPPRSEAENRVLARASLVGEAAAPRAGVPQASYWQSRLGTAAGLRALNEEHGSRFYQVPEEATLDWDAAAEALGGPELIIDVQTHYMGDRPGIPELTEAVLRTYRGLAPDWWSGLDGMVAYTMAEYLQCVFYGTANTMVVISSNPGLGPRRMLYNVEMAGTRELFDRLGPAGRLLNHSVVHPQVPGHLDMMEGWRDELGPVGWKVYTLGTAAEDGRGYIPGTQWRLDDDETGMPFLERCRQLGTKIVCAHKGVSFLAPSGGPEDVGPAAAAFPDIDLIIYHSGYEPPIPGVLPEVPYSAETRDVGVNRLVTSLAEAGVGPGSNVYAELGTTWFCLIRRPIEAAHVLGKLLLAVGEDNILWGTDSIWYGPAQPALDAFCAFQIPAEMQERYGYPALTDEVKEKILGLNAARVYGIDTEAALERARHDDLGWTREVLAEVQRSGVPEAPLDPALREV